MRQVLLLLALPAVYIAVGAAQSSAVIPIAMTRDLTDGQTITLRLALPLSNFTSDPWTKPHPWFMANTAIWTAVLWLPVAWFVGWSRRGAAPTRKGV